MPKLANIEKEIIEARLVGESFSEMTDSDKRYATDQIIITCSAIYGCGMPLTEGFAEVISRETLTLIEKFGYSELTLAEVLLAMQINTVGNVKYPSGVEVEKTKFSGSCFNTNFLSGVLSAYMSLRTILDRKFQNHIDGY